MPGRKARHEGGMPMANTSATHYGQAWEDAADSAVRTRTPQQYIDAVDSNYRTKSFTKSIGDSQEWLRKVDPQTKIYSAKSGAMDDLGFDHLVDELKNALDPESGLPRHLMLTPDAVKNMSMEKAVRRVADINAWRAAQQAEANQQIAGGPGQALVREYPHTPETPNPKGLRWVELKKAEQLPEGWSEVPDEKEDYSWFVDPQGQRHNTLNDPRHSDLEAQLKYEGDTMGHCVGGYCDDVISGESRIFSLRDAKGEPHVTVEVNPNRLDYEALHTKLLNDFGDTGKNILEGYRQQAVPGKSVLSEFIQDKYPEVWQKLTTAQPLITQIKGKQNRKPNDEYLPFVQDFVKNPPIEGVSAWGDVGDLQNSGLSKTEQGYMTQQEMQDAVKNVTDSNQALPEFAQGGRVSAPDVVKQFLSAQL
jgi:hypothetical protein